MADPAQELDALVEETVPTTEATKPAISDDELADLKAKAAQFEQYAPVLEELRNNPDLLNNARAAAVQQVAQPTTDDGQYWQDPINTTRQVARQEMEPQLKEMRRSVAMMALQNFESSKQSDPFAAVLLPRFRQQIGGMDMSQIGGMNAQAMQVLFSKLYSSIKGEYVDEVQAKKAKEKAANPPVNLGGGAGVGGSAPSKPASLDDFDPVAVRIMRQAGLTDEEIIKELGDEE